MIADVFVHGCGLDNFSLILFIQLSFLANRLTASEHGCGPSGNGSITILPVVTSLEATMSGESSTSRNPIRGFQSRRRRGDQGGAGRRTKLVQKQRKLHHEHWLRMRSFLPCSRRSVWELMQSGKTVRRFVSLR